MNTAPPVGEIFVIRVERFLKFEFLHDSPTALVHFQTFGVLSETDVGCSHIAKRIYHVGFPVDLR